jgi:hypothetical protein
MFQRTLVLVTLALAGVPARAEAVDDAWQAKAFAGISAAEYRFSFKDGLLEAPNRAHDLRTRLTGEGLSIVSRTRGTDGFHLGLSLVEYGLEPVGPGIVAAGERATNRHDGVTEWLENDTKGLTHGLVLERPPRTGEGPVSVRLSLDGAGAFPEGSEGKSVMLRNGKGEAVVRYGSLEAQDAVGRPVPVTMSVQAGSLVIVVDDGGAVWPITVQALASSPVWNVSINQAGASFGNAVSTAGDVDGNGYSDVIVGAYAYDEGQADEGKVFVFLGSAGGLSTSPAWSAQSDQAGANMGSSVSTAGDVNGDGYGDVIAGAYLYDLFATDGGAVLIWFGGPGGLGTNGTTANADWVSYGVQAFANLGTRVARAGDVNHDGYDDVIVSAWAYDNGTTFDDGAAFVWHGGPSGPPASPSWSKIYESDFGSANFGSAVAGAGDVNGDGYDDVVVGAYHDRDSAQWQGSVHLFYGSPTGLGSLVWAVYGLQGLCQLGASVAGVGDVNGDGYADIAAGAPTYDTPPFNTDDGRLFVWLGTSTIPNTAQSWSYASRQDDSHLGTSIAAAGDVNGDGYADVIAGADLWDATLADEGRAFVFHGGAAGPSTNPVWWADGGQVGASLGIHVGPAGDVNGDGYSDVIVGAFHWNDAQNDSGNARVYLGGPGGSKTSADWAVTAGQSFSQFGYSVSTAGDVNGDGFSDVVVGANLWDNGEIDEGAAFVYHGTSGGLSTSPAYTIESNQTSANLGFSVANAGDVDGDGFGDVIVGAYLSDGPDPNEGVAYVYRGSASGLTGARYTLEANQANAQFGWSVASAGDVNGDGYSDVVVGAPLWDGTQLNQGAAFVALGSPTGPGPLVRFATGIAQTNANFGHRVAGAGDVNRDGYSDVIVGVPNWDGGAGADVGRIFLHMGSASGLTDAPASWSPESAHSAWKLGFSIGSAGDVNGDGYADVIVAAPGYTNGESGEGGAFVYQGGPSGPTSPPAWSFTTDQIDAFLGDGTGVASAGDVNGDGYSDVVVGASSWQEGFNDFTGKAWVFLGSGTGLATTAAWSAVGGSAGNQFGFAVAPAGDVDGDGYSDVLIGEWVNHDGGNTAQGKGHVFYGNGGHGRPHVFIQYNGALTRRVSPLGFVDSDLVFRPLWSIGLPTGRTRMGIQVELKPVGVAFDGTGLLDIPNFDMTGSSIGAPVVSGLSPSTSYHWRVRYVRGSNPAFARTPWFGQADLSRTLTDFRTPCGNVTWYRDFDGDGHGNPSVTTSACAAPAGYVANSDDCDDATAARFPGNTEICDGLDNNCDAIVDNAAIPAGMVAMSFSKSGGLATFGWPPIFGASRYDLTRGLLGTLRATAGNFTPSVNQCTANVGTGGSDGATPAAGDGFWYAVRAVNCGGGTYDDGSATQAGLRDGEIAASPFVCP